MSVQAMSWVIDHSKMKSNAFVVLLMIANHAHADGTGAYPSIDLLARECRITPRSVIDQLKTLEVNGEIGVEKGAGPHGTNLYSLPLMRRESDGSVGGENFSCESGRGNPAEIPAALFTETIKNQRNHKNHQEYTPEFLLIWKAYPRKDKKFEAFKAFMKCDLNGDLGLILRSIEEHKASKDWQKDGGQFVPLLASYINGRRWEDEADESIG